MGPNDSNFMLMGLAKMDPGVKSPPHRHRYTQIFYFLEGHGQVIADGQAYDVSAGSVARFVHGEEHTVITPGPGPLSLIEVRVLPRGPTGWESYGLAAHLVTAAAARALHRGPRRRGSRDLARASP